MRFLRVIVVSAAVSSCFLPQLMSQARVVEDSWYEVFQRGVKQGYLHRKVTELKEGEKTRQLIELTAELEAKVLFNSGFSLYSEEKAALDENGIYEYRGVFKYGRVTLEVSGKREGDVFYIEEKQQGKDPRKYRVPREKYDLSSIERSEGILRAKGEERELRVLSFYSLNITGEIIKWDKEKDLKVDGEKVPCKVIRFWAHGVDGKRWFRLDGEGPMLREQGKSQEGKYYLVLTSEDKAKNWSKGNPYQ